MNYAGKFDAGLTLDGQGSRSSADSHVESFTATAHGHVPDGAVVIADPNLIFHGEFKRTGSDLVLSHDGHDFVVHDYFRGDKRAAIASPDGAHLTGDIVSALTGYVQVAQAAPGAAAAQVIGHVTKLTGSATVVRNGVSVILNNGDNVEKGDVVSTGSDSTLGITFIDGTVFGLSANARMVLNEMVYDPNGSNNSSLLSLVAGTITFVAGETAKHGDMKVDTPVATMGIRGTAVLTEIAFVVPSGGGDPQPQANFQVLVEPNGTTGSYILFDKQTLLPIATVNQAGQMIQISGGNVSVSNALLSPDVQKLINDVFTLKFTDNNTNTKLTNNSTDSITQIGDTVLIKTPDGSTAQAIFTNTVAGGAGSPAPGGSDKGGIERIPGAPFASVLDVNGNVATAFALTEHAKATGDHADATGDAVPQDITIFRINFVDQNLGDRPTVSVDLDASKYTYTDSGHHDVTPSLTALQKQDIAATQVKINVVADSGNNNNGTAVATYTIPDHAFDFLADGETLTLTYVVHVNNNFAVNPETKDIPITITITGTNDRPVITTSVPTITFSGGTSVPGGPLTTNVPTTGTLTFKDVDLTDTHTVSVALTSASLPDGTTVPPGPLAAFQKAMSVAIGNGLDSTGTGTGTINWSLADLPVYLADFIPKGEVLTLVYTVTVADEHNATSQQTITVTITGTDAAAVVWIGTNQPSGGFWKDAANWETGTVPTSKDDVIIITDQLHGLTPSYPVTIDAAAYGKSLTMDDYDTTVHHTAPEVINHSTLTLGGKLTLNADAKFTNAADGTVLVGGAIDVETITRTNGDVVASTAKITNAGQLTLAAGGKIDTLTTITNSGTIELSGGTLTLDTGIANAGGTVQVDSVATLVADAVTIDGGTLAIFGTLELDGTSLIENGTLNNSGVVHVKGAVEFANETVGNLSLGTIEVLADAALTIDKDSIVNNAGNISVDAHAEMFLNDATISGGAVSVESGSTLDLSSGTIDGGTLTLAGTLESTGASAISNADITNTGTISVTSGTLTIDPVIIHTLTNSKLLQANGGELDVTGEAIVNTADIKAIDGGILKLSSLNVTNNSGVVTVDGASKLYLTAASINGGSLSNSGHLYGVSGLNTISAGITNTGMIEVQAGTLNLSGGVAGAGSLVIDDGATLELAGATAQTVTFAGGADTLELDKVGGRSFTGTITGQSSTGGTFTVTGAADITTSSGDALDFTASGGMAGAPGNVVLTPTGTLKGAANGVVVTQNGAGNISLTATGDTTGLAGNGIALTDSATGSGNITIDNLTGKATGTGANSEGILVENLNAANAGDISITQLGGAVGGAYGIDATTHGDGDVTIDAGGNVTGSSIYAIRARSYGVGDIKVTTESGSVVTSDSSGIVAVNRATSLDASEDSTITVNAHGTINSGSGLNQSGNTPAGIQAGYNGATTGSVANTDVNGSVVVNNYADITSGGHGIHAYNYGNGDVTVNDGAGTTVTGAVAGIKASAISGGTGDVTVNIGANAHVEATSGYGIDAYSLNAGDISVVMSHGDVLKSGSVGIDAVNEATAIGSDVHSTIFVSAHGTIHSGVINTKSNHAPAGIMAGYTGGGSNFDGAVHGDVTVQSDATIITDAGSGIAAFTQGVGTVTVTTGEGSSITAAGTAINVFDLGGGDINVTNGGSATGAAGLTAFGNGAANITITNDGHITGTSGVGIGVTQAFNATGQVHITNDADGRVTGADGFAAISVHAGSSASVLIDNSGTIGLDDAGSVTSTTSAIVETGGPVTINNSGHINGNISAATATFNNEMHGTWTVSGTSVFGNLSSIVNDGVIDLLNGASISGTGLGINSSNEIDSWGAASISGTIVNTGTIEVNTGTLSLFGSLSGSGSVTIDANATLDVDAAVSQTITFNGGGAELQIDTSSFGGAVAGFASTDKLDLSTIAFDGGTSATYDSATGDLVVSDAYGHSITVKLTGGDYSNAHFAGSSDGHGGTLITLNAADDAPAFNAAEASPSVSFAELDNKTGDATTDPASGGTGTIDFTDIDLTERPTAKITHQDVAWLAADHTTALTLTPDEISALEHALTLQQAGSKNNGTVGWSYSITDSALDFLGQGQTATVVSTITLDDGHKTDTAEVTVTISGANDAPALADLDIGTLADTGVSDSFADLTGKLAGTDADTGETATLSYALLDAEHNATTTVAGQYGSLTVDSSGNYDYVPDSAAINALQAGAYVDTFTVQTTDTHGAHGTATLTVNVNGANDAPTLDGTTLDSVAADNTNPTGSAVSDLFAGKFHDVDTGASFKAIAVSADNATSDQGSWQYEIAGTDQWVDISGVSNTHALVLSTDTLIRFVPNESFSGTPGTLDVHAIDNTYTGAVSASSPVSIDISGAGHGGTTPVSDQAASIGTEVTAPAEVEMAVAPVLSLGPNTSIYPTDGSALVTPLSLHAGDIVSVDWNFTTDDYLPYNDFAFASVNGAAFLLSDIAATGSYGSTGWHTFTYKIQTDGTYAFGAGVMNEQDYAVTSFLAVDNIRVNGEVVQSFENGFGDTRVTGQVAIVSTAHSDVNGSQIVPTDGNFEAFLSSYPAYTASIEDFLGLSSGELSNIAKSEGPEHTPINVPITVTIPTGAHPDDTYVTIAGAPVGSEFNYGTYDAGNNTWHIEATDLGGNLTLTTPVGYAGSFNITVTATSVVDSSHTSATTLPQTHAVTIDPLAGPEIDTTHFTVSENPDGTTSVLGLAITDEDPAAPSEAFALSASTQAGASSVSPATAAGSLNEINNLLKSGVTYNPGQDKPATDMITFKVTDNFGASDTVNFVFNEGGSGPVSLVGTSGKDVLFASGQSDTLDGKGGQDQFVFAPKFFSDTVQHTVYEFDTTLDKIDVRQFDNINSFSDIILTQQNADTLVRLDDHETILLKNVAVNNLHASDFIVTNHSVGGSV
ncbi:VCBS domain-containing protein [Bradyrhizobium sp. BR 10261]|uniref:VCBS domain-containing protein n=1 Tax=Bradyrhizobium sp. BR 10261 TaxID=2749992 RepID=UPI001C653FFE|nr:FecR domain-containing protein [Bradyrhizobium sp. BR 10261]